jgi:hypothetical protein
MSEETAKKTDLFVLKREAGGEPFKFKVGAKTLTIPHIASVDQFELAAVWATEHETDLAFLTDFFRFLLGDDFETLRGLHLTRPELMNLHDAYNAHCGTKPGESAASPV